MIYELEITYTDYSNPKVPVRSKEFKFDSKQARDTAHADAVSRINQKGGIITIKNMSNGGKETFTYDKITSVNISEFDDNYSWYG
ncbi:hypothetical protein LCGC14_2738830 [marine sediment metagenome]|uniref:Uncharacterized protein n=1 Tax=marine sediment metagenome TaxID=412755 RepID=A0A0F8ZSE9_9ZZZZ